ncbi:MAG: hypothetical protein O6945_00110 [Gammaproteobacteria bacterium]|nr:hypothetical protein [Gammaproteobacteria bacterium]
MEFTLILSTRFYDCCNTEMRWDDSIDRWIISTNRGEAAETDWVETIIKLARKNQEFLADCTPGYYNNEGKPAERALQNANYGAGSEAFFKVLREWRDEGSLAGLIKRSPNPYPPTYLPSAHLPHRQT